MYAKVFSQIFDSSIADDFRLRHFFMDLLVLADSDGVVDMTPTAIAARTRIPLEDVAAMLATLEEPDPESRTPDHEGRRIARLDAHRTWGWCIVNYDSFRKIASDEQRRDRTRERVASFRKKNQQNQPCNAPVTPCNAPVTHGNACNAMQKQKQKQKQSTEDIHTLLYDTNRVEPSSVPPKQSACADAQTEPPAGFPKTEAEAIACGAIVGVPEASTLKAYNMAVYRGYCDGRGIVIRNFPKYLKTVQAFEQDRLARTPATHLSTKDQAAKARHSALDRDLQRLANL